MRIAVVGSGISGLGAAWLLSREHEVTLFESDTRLGGHTHTHEVELAGRSYAIDSGFIVYNELNYPLLAALFSRLGVASQPTTMSFSVQCEASGLEYNAGTVDGLFCQRRNLYSPGFLRMVRDLLRFYREAPTVLERPAPGPTLGEFLTERRYGAAFRDLHLVPMSSALWSAPRHEVLRMPARFLVSFMANHQMLQVQGRPQWRVVRGGSACYVRELRRRWTVRERAGCAVSHVRRRSGFVEIDSPAGRETYDQVVLACHSDQALRLLADASERERGILGALRYQRNEAVLHTDARLLPGRRRAWAAWNVFVPRDPGGECTVSYCMNLLQGIESPRPFVVTLNRTAEIDPSLVLHRMSYEHPVYTHDAVAAQARRGEIQGRDRTWFAGAYWGRGFHEDGLRSAADVARGLGVSAWPRTELAQPAGITHPFCAGASA